MTSGRLSDARLLDVALRADATPLEIEAMAEELRDRRAAGGEAVAWAGKRVKLPDWDAAHSERLSPEQLRIADGALGEYAYGNLSMGYGVTVTVREVGRLIEAARLHPSNSGVDVKALERPSGCAGEMTPERAVYFLERFKSEEKMLGPHEQWALAYSIAILAALHPSPDTGNEPPAKS